MKIKGIRALCSATKNLTPVGYAPNYKLQVHLDKATGKLYWADVVGTGYIQYNDPNMMFVCNIEHPATMAEIREMIEDNQRVQYALDSIEF
jgi:hypothetical protein